MVVARRDALDDALDEDADEVTELALDNILPDFAADDDDDDDDALARCAYPEPEEGNWLCCILWLFVSKLRPLLRLLPGALLWLPALLLALLRGLEPPPYRWRDELSDACLTRGESTRAGDATPYPLLRFSSVPAVPVPGEEEVALSDETCSPALSRLSR